MLLKGSIQRLSEYFFKRLCCHRRKESHLNLITLVDPYFSHFLNELLKLHHFLGRVQGLVLGNFWCPGQFWMQTMWREGKILLCLHVERTQQRVGRLKILERDSQWKSQRRWKDKGMVWNWETEDISSSETGWKGRWEGALENTLVGRREAERIYPWWHWFSLYASQTSSLLKVRWAGVMKV